MTRIWAIAALTLPGAADVILLQAQEPAKDVVAAARAIPDGGTYVWADGSGTRATFVTTARSF